MADAHLPPIGSVSSPADALVRATGTQALSRALTLLFRIATEGHEGMRLSELSARAQLDAATARRLLLCLQHHGFVEQDPHSRRYFLGLDFFNLAAAASNRFDLASTIRSALSRLSHQSGETSVCFSRSGADIVCTDMIRTAGYAGSEPLDIGSRRVIGSGAFGMAMLAALDTDEGEAIVLDNLRRFSRVPEDDARRIGEQIRQTRRRGYALASDEGGVHSIAVAILTRTGKPDRVLGLCGIGTGRRQRLASLARTLIGAARHIEDSLWRIPSQPDAPPPAGIGSDPGCGVSPCEMPAPL